MESVESLENELQSTRNENARLNTTVQVLKSELLERISEAERLKRSNEDLNGSRAERDRLEAERRALSVLVEHLRTRLNELRGVREERDRLRGECDRLRNCHAMLPS
jgi:hypothetical protein